MSIHMTRSLRTTGALLAFALAATCAAQTPESSATTGTAPALQQYAVEFRTGPGWVEGKPPYEQNHFGEHSANLRRLREAGVLRIGARYSDKGLVVLEAPSLEAARGMIEADPSIAAGTFVYEVHELWVFYGGSLRTPEWRE